MITFAEMCTVTEWTFFAVCQSRIHVAWATRFSSSLETRLKYTATRAFVTFPFPSTNPRTTTPALEAIGRRLHDARAEYMRAAEQGLTKTYNALKDASCTDERVLELRRIHEDMDRAVLAAYGWADGLVSVPPYCSTTPAERQAVQDFEKEVIERLYQLNAERAREEARLGAASCVGKRKTRSKAAGK